MSRKLLKQAMDDAYAIRLAKTELRDAYNRGDVNGVLAVFADAYSDMSAGLASFYGPEAQAVLRYRMKQLFARYRALLWHRSTGSASVSHEATLRAIPCPTSGHNHLDSRSRPAGF